MKLWFFLLNYKAFCTENIENEGKSTKRSKETYGFYDVTYEIEKLNDNSIKIKIIE